MNNIQDLELLASEIKKDKQARKITPRQLFNTFGFSRRTRNNCSYVDKFLEDNDLEVDPNYSEVWIDADVSLKHKQVATTKSPKGSIKKVKIMEAANKKPIFIDNSAKLNEAVTIMQLNNYSQLPVTNNGERGLCGYISWETIGVASFNGIKSDYVKDYISKDIEVIEINTPILEAIKKIYNNEFAVVVGEDKALCGIITIADISSQFLSITEPFILLEQIENQIRIIFHGCFLLEELKEVCTEENREITSIDDLTFGEYIRLIEKEEKWEKLNLSADKKVFIKRLDDIRQIRNDVMHFEPAGITKLQHEVLKRTTIYLKQIIEHRYLAQTISENIT